MSKDFSLHPELASTFALQIDLLYFLLVAISVIFTVAIVAVIIFFVIKYRRKSDDERPKPIHGSLPLELAWSIIPFFICMGVFTLGAICSSACIEHQQTHSTCMSLANNGCGRCNTRKASVKSMSCMYR